MDAASSPFFYLLEASFPHASLFTPKMMTVCRPPRIIDQDESDKMHIGASVEYIWVLLVFVLVTSCKK